MAFGCRRAFSERIERKRKYLQVMIYAVVGIIAWMNPPSGREAFADAA